MNFIYRYRLKAVIKETDALLARLAVVPDDDVQQLVQLKRVYNRMLDFATRTRRVTERAGLVMELPTISFAYPCDQSYAALQRFLRVRREELVGLVKS